MNWFIASRFSMHAPFSPFFYARWRPEDPLPRPIFRPIALRLRDTFDRATFSTVTARYQPSPRCFVSPRGELESLANDLSLQGLRCTYARVTQEEWFALQWRASTADKWRPCDRLAFRPAETRSFSLLSLCVFSSNFVTLRAAMDFFLTRTKEFVLRPITR